MIHLLKAEFDYAKWGLLFFIILLPPVYIWWNTSVDSEHGIQFTLWMAFMLNTLIPQPKKEKRERLIGVFPVSVLKRGISRLLMIILPCLTMILFIYILPVLLNINIKINHVEIWASFSIILIIYGIFFIYQDTVSGKPTRTKSRMKIIFIASLITLVVFLILGIIIEEASDSISFGINRFVDSIEQSGFFNGISGLVRFLMISLFIFGFSVWTYNRRASFAD